MNRNFISELKSNAQPQEHTFWKAGPREKSKLPACAATSRVRLLMRKRPPCHSACVVNSSECGSSVGLESRSSSYSRDISPEDTRAEASCDAPEDASTGGGSAVVAGLADGGLAAMVTLRPYVHERAAVCPWRVAGQWNSPVSRTVVWAGHDSGRGQGTYRERGVGAGEEREGEGGGAASNDAKMGNRERKREIEREGNVEAADTTKISPVVIHALDCKDRQPNYVL